MIGGPNHLSWRIVAMVVTVVLILVGSPLRAEECIRLKATHRDGVPIHAEAQNSFTGKRLPDGTIVVVEERAASDRWLHIRSGQTTGWISSKYIASPADCALLDATADGPWIRVGTWNLEWFKDGKARGFPEYKDAEALPPRTDDDYQYIAGIIHRLELKILVLQEINGYTVTDDEEDADSIRSHELDLLVSKLGEDAYEYVIGSSGRGQRIAFLHDKRAANLLWTCEAALPNQRVQDSSLFARQPFLAYFQLWLNGAEMNDFAIVGVHLASGQKKTRNHEIAMAKIVSWISEERESNGCIPHGEFDIMIAGDFNANRFDGFKEVFWDDMEAHGWDVLANDPSYPATRLSGRPPAQRASKIDYIIISSVEGGLAGEEIYDTVATVHSELVGAAGGGLEFRKRASDHLPVTVAVRVVPDTD